MSAVIVSIKQVGEVEGRDVEIPSDMPMRDLTTLLAHTYGWPTHGVEYCVEEIRSRRKLAASETLAQAGLWDGSDLLVTLQQISAACQPTTMASATAPTHKTPPPGAELSANDLSVSANDLQRLDVTWQQVDIPLPPATPVPAAHYEPQRQQEPGHTLSAPIPPSPPPDEPASTGDGYVWKRID